jgi:hypothetical protein
LKGEFGGLDRDATHRSVPLVLFLVILEHALFSVATAKLDCLYNT